MLRRRARLYRTEHVRLLLVPLCCLVVAGAVRAEPAILVSSQSTGNILRFHGETGEFVSVHVPRGLMMTPNGMAVGPNCEYLLVACGLLNSVLRFDLETGAFIDEFVKPGAGGLGDPTFIAFNSANSCAWNGTTSFPAARGSSGDGQLYAVGKDKDAVLRYAGMPLASRAAAGLSFPCPDGAQPGDPCPGPLGDPTTAEFIPEENSVWVNEFARCDWDRNGDLHSALPGRLTHRRYRGFDGQLKPSAWAKEHDVSDTHEYVFAGDGGLELPAGGIIGPDGNLFLGNGKVNAVCQSGAIVLRYAGPLPEGVFPGDAEDDRGACIGLDEGEPCPGPLGAPGTALFAPLADCVAPAFPHLSPDGNILVLHGDRLHRFAGPVPDGPDTRGQCAAFIPGSPCPGPLGAPGSSLFLPTDYGVGIYRLQWPLVGMIFVDLPPAEPCVVANDMCADATLLPSDLDQTIPFSNICATTDGPSEVSCTGDVGQVFVDEPFGYDVWYHYIAPADGVLNLTTTESVACVHDDPRCAWDGMLAVYGGEETCGCPVDNGTLVGCNDEAFMQEDGTVYLGGSPSDLSVSVKKGMCYTIRAGGYDQFPRAQGGPTGTADMTLRFDSCPDTQAPLPVQVSAANRSLSFKIDSSETMAIRITAVDLPGAWAVRNDTSMWVHAPSEYCEFGSIAEPDGAGLCPSGTGKYLAAELACNPADFDWSTYGEFSVVSQFIIPGGVYDVQTVLAGCSEHPDAHSAPLRFKTSGWGDIVGQFDPVPQEWTFADGQNQIGDVLALLAKFVGAPSAPSKVRCDLEPGNPDALINISDVLFAIRGFVGLDYPFVPSDPPCS